MHDEISKQVEKISTVEQSVYGSSHLVVLGYMCVRRWVTPLLPCVEFVARHSVSEDQLIHPSAKRVGVIELRSFPAVPGTLLRAFCPIYVPISPCGFGFDVDDRDAVDK